MFSLCPVALMSIPVSCACQHQHFLLSTNTEQILMKFMTGNHYHQAPTDELITFWAKLYQGKGAGDDRKLELTSNWCCHVLSDFTAHIAKCICRAGDSITHMPQQRQHTTTCGL